MTPAQSIRRGLVLVLLSVGCASVNLTKPVHIDDAGHVEISQRVLRNPLRVMTLEANWLDTVQPLASYGRPALLFYLFAGVMAIAGESLLALHLFIAMLSTGVTVGFYFLAKRFMPPNRALVYTTLLVLGPAYLPGQGLMTDVPLMVFWLTAFWTMITAGEARSHRRYAVGAAAIALGCLVKYTSLVLIPVLCVVILMRRHWRCFWVLAIPVAVLGAWSWFNYWEYGGIHLLHSPSIPLSGIKVFVYGIDWVAGLGSVAPFSVMFLVSPARRRIGKAPLVIGMLGGGLVYLLGRGLLCPDAPQCIVLTWAVFSANGIFVGLVTIRSLWQHVISVRNEGDRTALEQDGILLIWLASATFFVVAFAPLMAIRHVVLALMPILLVLGRGLGSLVPRSWTAVGLAGTVALGFVLALSDCVYADVYRQYAPRIMNELPPGARIWYAGHWGWQWYAEKVGMIQYDTKRTRFETGDYLVLPLGVSRQEIPPEHTRVLKKIREIRADAPPITWMRTMRISPWGGYYAFSIHRGGPPWSLTRSDLERFEVFVVTDASNP